MTVYVGFSIGVGVEFSTIVGFECCVSRDCCGAFFLPRLLPSTPKGWLPLFEFGMVAVGLEFPAGYI